MTTSLCTKTFRRLWENVKCKRACVLALLQLLRVFLVASFLGARYSEELYNQASMTFRPWP